MRACALAVGVVVAAVALDDGDAPEGDAEAAGEEGDAKAVHATVFQDGGLVRLELRFTKREAEAVAEMEVEASEAETEAPAEEAEAPAPAALSVMPTFRNPEMANRAFHHNKQQGAAPAAAARGGGKDPAAPRSKTTYAYASNPPQADARMASPANEAAAGVLQQLSGAPPEDPLEEDFMSVEAAHAAQAAADAAFVFEPDYPYKWGDSVYALETLPASPKAADAGSYRIPLKRGAPKPKPKPKETTAYYEATLLRIDGTTYPPYTVQLLEGPQAGAVTKAGSLALERRFGLGQRVRYRQEPESSGGVVLWSQMRGTVHVGQSGEHWRRDLVRVVWDRDWDGVCGTEMVWNKNLVLVAPGEEAPPPPDLTNTTLGRALAFGFGSAMAAYRAIAGAPIDERSEDDLSYDVCNKLLFIAATSARRALAARCDPEDGRKSRDDQEPNRLVVALNAQTARMDKLRGELAGVINRPAAAEEPVVAAAAVGAVAAEATPAAAPKATPKKPPRVTKGARVVAAGAQPVQPLAKSSEKAVRSKDPARAARIRQGLEPFVPPTRLAVGGPYGSRNPRPGKSPADKAKAAAAAEAEAEAAAAAYAVDDWVEFGFRNLSGEGRVVPMVGKLREVGETVRLEVPAMDYGCITVASDAIIRKCAPPTEEAEAEAEAEATAAAAPTKRKDGRPRRSEELCKVGSYCELEAVAPTKGRGGGQKRKEAPAPAPAASPAKQRRPSRPTAALPVSPEATAKKGKAAEAVTPTSGAESLRILGVVENAAKAAATRVIQAITAGNHEVARSDQEGAIKAVGDAIYAVLNPPGMRAQVKCLRPKDRAGLKAELQKFFFSERLEEYLGELRRAA